MCRLPTRSAAISQTTVAWQIPNFKEFPANMQIPRRLQRFTGVHTSAGRRCCCLSAFSFHLTSMWAVFLSGHAFSNSEVCRTLFQFSNPPLKHTHTCCCVSSAQHSFVFYPAYLFCPTSFFLTRLLTNCKKNLKTIFREERLNHDHKPVKLRSQYLQQHVVKRPPLTMQSPCTHVSAVFGLYLQKALLKLN